MALGKLMTVFEIHNHCLSNLCCPEGAFIVPYGHVNPEQMLRAYPDRRVDGT